MKSITPLSPVAPSSPRREFLRQMAMGAAFFTVRGAFAEELSRKTASSEEGPFYPPKLPLDTDNDLIIVNNSITPAVGQITHLSGRLLSASGSPIRNATVEIWEVDHSGIYLADQPNRAKYDANFQGFGRFLTGSTGEYYFRAIRPVRYPGRRAPHIHFKIRRQGQEPWNTQLFVKGEPGNEQDGIYMKIGDAQARETVTVDFVPLPDSRIGEVAARFDIILGAS
ncbi:MAG TPA: protocatechuate 3,4-dioxygenase [Verrucomicrobiae bacterium]|jgi:protocatechuate 3,4-dioxygenase beta subunit|nr:protocatechuate 3,4-dioxygenase [Verrucomicrobiae bacterium]